MSDKANYLMGGGGGGGRGGGGGGGGIKYVERFGSFCHIIKNKIVLKIYIYSYLR